MRRLKFSRVKFKLRELKRKPPHRNRKTVAGESPAAAASEPIVAPAGPALPPKNSAARKFLFLAAANFLGLVAALVLFEIFLRLFQIKPVRYAEARTLAWDGARFRDCGASTWGNGLIKTNSRFAALGVDMGEYVPGAAFINVFPDNPRGYFDRSNAVLMTVNALGLRGEPATAEKPAGTCRILGLGDSFTFGFGVKDEDTFLHRLQTRLNALGTNRFEVLNAGVQGYNTRDEVLNLEHRWLALQPDLVLIFFYINDAYNDRAILNQGQELGIYEDQPNDLAQYSYLWDLAQHRYHTRRLAKSVEAFYHKSFFTNAQAFFQTPGAARMDWIVGAAALKRARQITRERGIQLGLVMFPELYKLKRGYPFHSIHKLVGETCRQLDIPFLDLYDTFHGKNPASLWVHPSDHHPNEIAHALAETAIERFVRETFLSPGSP